MTRAMSATDRAYHETRGRILDGELGPFDEVREVRLEERELAIICWRGELQQVDVRQV